MGSSSSRGVENGLVRAQERSRRGVAQGRRLIVVPTSESE